MPYHQVLVDEYAISGIRYPSSSWHASYYDATAAGVHRAPESVEQAMLEGILLWVH
jgi:hypothetical protein